MASKYYTKSEELKGATIGRWLVGGPAVNPAGHWEAPCRCECGAEKLVRVEKLINGHSKSCGCLRNDSLTIHGRTKSAIRSGSREYWIWNTMKQRCQNSNHAGFKDYGGRGIRVCDRWQTFVNFYEDMGKKPKGKSLDRIDNAGNYDPGNCCWSDRKTQNSNKRNNRHFTVAGESLTLAECARRAGISHATIIARIKAGWPEQVAVTAPKGTQLKRAL